MTRHQWREDNGDEVRFWRANYHGGRFELYTKVKEEDRWDKLDPPKKEDWQVLPYKFHEYHIKKMVRTLLVSYLSVENQYCHSKLSILYRSI